MAHERLQRNEILSKFIIPHDYGTTGVFPYGAGASIVLSKVSYTSCYDGDSWSTNVVGIHRNKEHRVHAEMKLVDLLERSISSHAREIDIKLIQNFSPCNDDENNTFCAQQIVDYKMKMEDQGKQIDISITFANFYRTVEYYGNTEDRAKKNRRGIRLLHDNRVQLRLLRGKVAWRKFLEDKRFVRLSDVDWDACWLQVISVGRKERESFDKKHLMQILTDDDLAYRIENLQVND